MIEKWSAQGSMRRIDGGHAWPQVPTGGVGGESTKQPEDQYLRSSTPIGLKAWRILLFWTADSDSSGQNTYITSREGLVVKSMVKTLRTDKSKHR